MSVQLKPCPFCGGSAHLDTVGKGGSRHAAVFCDDILCPGVVHGVGAGIDRQRVSAVSRWNTRPSDAAAEARGITEGLARAIEIVFEKNEDGYVICPDSYGIVDALRYEIAIRALPHNPIKADEGASNG